MDVYIALIRVSCVGVPYALAAGDEAAAVDEARTLLADTQGARGYDLWRNGIMVARFRVPSAADVVVELV